MKISPYCLLSLIAYQAHTTELSVDGLSALSWLSADNKQWLSFSLTTDYSRLAPKVIYASGDYEMLYYGLSYQGGDRDRLHWSTGIGWTSLFSDQNLDETCKTQYPLVAELESGFGFRLTTDIRLTVGGSLQAGLLSMNTWKQCAYYGHADGAAVSVDNTATDANADTTNVGAQDVSPHPLPNINFSNDYLSSDDLPYVLNISPYIRIEYIF